LTAAFGLSDVGVNRCSLASSCGSEWTWASQRQALPWDRGSLARTDLRQT